MKKTVMAILLGMITTNVLAENIPYDQAKKAGVKKCLPVIKKFTEFIIEDGDAGAHSFWNTDNPDSYPFSTVIEKNFTDGSHFFANLIISPTPNGECYVEYEKIVNMKKPCIATAQELEGAKYRTEINKVVSLLEDGTAIYLIPNGNQCTMVRKEVIANGLKL